MSRTFQWSTVAQLGVQNIKKWANLGMKTWGASCTVAYSNPPSPLLLFSCYDPRIPNRSSCQACSNKGPLGLEDGNLSLVSLTINLKLSSDKPNINWGDNRLKVQYISQSAEMSQSLRSVNGARLQKLRMEVSFGIIFICPPLHYIKNPYLKQKFEFFLGCCLQNNIHFDNTPKHWQLLLELKPSQTGTSFTSRSILDLLYVNTRKCFYLLAPPLHTPPQTLRGQPKDRIQRRIKTDFKTVDITGSNVKKAMTTNEK